MGSRSKPETIYDLRDSEHELVTDSQDVEEIRKAFPKSKNARRCDGFLVLYDTEADPPYREIWGFEGIMPEMGKRVYEVVVRRR